MRYLVVLYRDSVIGSNYAEGSNDGFILVNDVQHPVLDCIDVIHEAYYLLVTRDMKKTKGGTQTLYIPHASIAFIVGYAKGDERPIGFASSK